MSEAQKGKILDVMHTLSCIRDGNTFNPRVSADACWKVLQQVLDLEEPSEN